LQNDHAIVLICNEDGTHVKSHIIDRSFLCSRFVFFAKTLKWKEERKGNEKPEKLVTIRVFRDKPRVFGLYKDCLANDFPLEPTAFMPSNADNENASEANGVREPTEKDKVAVGKGYKKIGTLYTLANYLIDHRLKNRLLRATVQAAHATRADDRAWLPTNSFISETYERTTEGDKMRELLVELYVDFADGTWLTEGDRKPLPKDCLFDCLRGVTAKRHRDALAHSKSKTYNYRNFQYKPEEIKMGQRG
jgi:hypothetical protein